MADKHRPSFAQTTPLPLRRPSLQTLHSIHLQRLDQIRSGGASFECSTKQTNSKDKSKTKTKDKDKGSVRGENVAKKMWAKRVDGENKRLVDKMKKILTHSVPFWESRSHGMSAPVVNPKMKRERGRVKPLLETIANTSNQEYDDDFADEKAEAESDNKNIYANDFADDDNSNSKKIDHTHPTNKPPTMPPPPSSSSRPQSAKQPLRSSSKSNTTTELRPKSASYSTRHKSHSNKNNITSITGLFRLREMERIQRDNIKISNHIENTGAYYSNSKMAEGFKYKTKSTDKESSKIEMERVVNVGLRGVYKYVKDNERRIDEWEQECESRKYTDFERRAKIEKKVNTTMSRPKSAPPKREPPQFRRKTTIELHHGNQKLQAKTDANMTIVADREIRASRGLALAASKFNSILVRNEECMNLASEELTLLANIANRECTNYWSENYRNPNVNEDFVKTEGIQRIRKTLIQQRQDDGIGLLIKKMGVEKVKKTTHFSHKTDKPSSDYLSKAWEVIGAFQSGSPKHTAVRSLPVSFETEALMSPNKHKTQARLLRALTGLATTCTSLKPSEIGGINVWDQDDLYDCEDVDVKYDLSEPNEDDILDVKKGVMSCDIVARIVSNDEMMITLKGKCKKGMMMIDDVEHVMRIPTLVLVDREAAVGYAKRLIGRIVLRPRKVGESDSKGENNLFERMEWSLDTTRERMMG